MDRDITGSQLAAGYLFEKRFEVRETIAVGGMGCVYLAHNLALDMPVAIKVLRADLATRPEAMDGFRREAQLASAVKHSNIARIIDYGWSDRGLPYMVMEYVQGPSLGALVRREGPQPVERVVVLMQQLLAALDELHVNGIAHGDVTSDNLLLQPTKGQSLRLKLVDFGLARRLLPFDDQALPLPLRRDTRVSGTPGYMAPEVIRGAPLSGAADMYSAGVVLHELLTGQLPFAAATPLEPMTTQVTNELVPPSVRFPLLQIPQGFDTLVGRALSTHEHERFAPADLGAALAAASLQIDPTPVVIAQAAARGQLVTVVDPRLVGAATDRPRSRHERLRDWIGKALRLGDIDHLADLYLGLVQLLRQTGDPSAAMAELGEAIDVLTKGRGRRADAGPRAMWRLLLVLAELQAMRGELALARASAAFAYRHAERVGSTRGCSRVLLFLQRPPLG